MTCKEIQQPEPEMSTAEVASEYVRRMVQKEHIGWGDQNSALDRLERRYGLPFWTLNNLRIGRAKTVEAGLFARIKAAYIDLCEREIAKLHSELLIAKAISNDDSFEDLEREAQDLASRIAQRKAGI